MSEAKDYSIKEAAELSGLSKDTIRYYEKISLLPRAERRESRHRVYRRVDIETMKLVMCLKKTGMPLEEMKPYLRLSAGDRVTDFPDLHEKIQSYRQAILEQIAYLQQSVDFIDAHMSSGRSLGLNCEESDEEQTAAQ